MIGPSIRKKLNQCDSNTGSSSTLALGFVLRPNSLAGDRLLLLLLLLLMQGRLQIHKPKAATSKLLLLHTQSNAADHWAADESLIAQLAQLPVTLDRIGQIFKWAASFACYLPLSSSIHPLNRAIAAATMSFARVSISLTTLDQKLQYRI